MKNSKFLKLYNIVMESVSLNPLDLRNTILEVLKSLPNPDDQFWSSGKEQLIKDDIDVNKYEVIVSGGGSFKLVRKKLTSGSGKYKWSPVLKYSEINAAKISSNSYKNAIFYVLKIQEEQAIKNGEVFDIRVPSNAGAKEQQEEAQISDFQDQIDQAGGEIKVITPDDNDPLKGPYDKITKAVSNRPRPKADAVLLNTKDKSVDKLYLSLKDGGGPAKFKQYGGKEDISKASRKDIDADIIENNPFIKECYNKVIALFESINTTNGVDLDYNFLNLKSFLANSDLEKVTANIVFKIPEDEIENINLLKTKFGQDFSIDNKDSSPENVDALIDGKIGANNDPDSKIKKIDGKYHTEWNPSIYNVKNDDDKNEAYEMVIVFAPYSSGKMKFGKLKQCRFNTFPYDRYKNYLKTTNKIFEKFLN
jgi:hypothetical protein